VNNDVLVQLTVVWFVNNDVLVQLTTFILSTE
jgi:hypothetical protein